MWIAINKQAFFNSKTKAKFQDTQDTMVYLMSAIVLGFKTETLGLRSKDMTDYVIRLLT